MTSCLKVIIMFVIATCHGQKSDVQIVRISQGRLKGAILSLRDGTPYYSFKGVPYARAPIRFKAPQPPNSWQGIREAINHGPVCTQYDNTVDQFREGSEECLYVNIYTKTLQQDAKLPVMVYIHGGSFMSQSGDNNTLGPEFLLQHDIILVTLNYRLEVLGFLAMDVPEAPGNAGMKDQVAALQWVKRNIGKFGGDNNKVTIFGESSGAAAVTYHMLSTMSKGLFNKAIVQSGVCLQDWAVQKRSQERGFDVGKELEKVTSNPHKLVKYLRSVPALQLTNMTLKTATDGEMKRSLPEYFVPVVEKKFNDIPAFLNEHPLKTIVSRKYSKVPLMIGYNSNEGLVILGDFLKKLQFINENPRYLVPEELSKRITLEKEKDFGERILRFYVGDRRNLTRNDGQIISNMQSDIHFFYNTHRFVDSYLKHGKNDHPIYMYRFGYSTELNIVKNLILELQNYMGASHADDLFYLFFNTLNKEIYDKNPTLRDIVFKVTKLWADFARTGDPTPDSAGFKWRPYTEKGKEFFNMDKEWTMGSYAERDRMEFWNELYCEARTLCMC